MPGDPVLVCGPLPAFRFFQPASDNQGKQGGNRADDEHWPPRIANNAMLDKAGHGHADDRGRDISNRGKHLQRGEGIGPGPFRHDFRHQRDADREFAADAEAGQEPKQHEVIDALRERAQAGKERVKKDRDHHGLGSADPIAQHAKDQAATGPTHQKD